MSTAQVIDFRTDIDTAGLDRLVAAMSGAGRQNAMGNVAKEMGMITRLHLGAIAARRHATATRLNATPSGHLKQGESASVVKDAATEDAATVEISIPGIRRAFRPLTIRPRDKQFLTIPLNAIAYNRSVGDLRREGVPIFRLGKTKILATKGPDNKPLPLYALATQAMVPQDRELLPSDEEYAETASGAFVAAINTMRGQA